MSSRNAYRADGIDTLGGALRRWADRRVDANRAVARGYAQRADQQNEWYLAGDPRGIYGGEPDPPEPSVPPHQPHEERGWVQSSPLRELRVEEGTFPPPPFRGVTRINGQYVLLDGNGNGIDIAGNQFRLTDGSQGIA